MVDGTAELSHTQELPTIVITSDGQHEAGMSVSDRIQTLERRQSVSKTLTGEVAPENDKSTHLTTNVPLVFPLHLQRFHRRGADGQVLRPDTPLNTSHVQSAMRAPQPVRKLSTTIQAADLLPSSHPTTNPTRLDALYEQIEPLATPDPLRPKKFPPSKQFSRQQYSLNSDVDFSKLKSEQVMERSRCGTYIPVGLVASKSNVKDQMVLKQEKCKATITQSTITAAHSEQSKHTPLPQIIISRIMPEHIEAIIFHQGGKPDHVVLNSQNGPTMAELLQTIDQVSAELKMSFESGQH